MKKLYNKIVNWIDNCSGGLLLVVGGIVISIIFGAIAFLCNPNAHLNFDLSGALGL